jgi:hypothetical protein
MGTDCVLCEAGTDFWYCSDGMHEPERQNVYWRIKDSRCRIGGRDSVFGTATRYGLDGPRIGSRWGRHLPHPCSPTLGPTQPPLQRVLVLFPRGKAAEAWRWPPTTSSTEVKGRLELYFYSPPWAFLTRSRVNFTFYILDDGSKTEKNSLVTLSFFLVIVSMVLYHKIWDPESILHRKDGNRDKFPLVLRLKW